MYLPGNSPVIHYQRGESSQYIPCGTVKYSVSPIRVQSRTPSGDSILLKCTAGGTAFLVQCNMADPYIMVRIFPAGVSDRDHAPAPPALSPPWPDPAGTAPQGIPRSVTPHSHMFFRQFPAFLVRGAPVILVGGAMPGTGPRPIVGVALLPRRKAIGSNVMAGMGKQDMFFIRCTPFPRPRYFIDGISRITMSITEMYRPA